MEAVDLYNEFRSLIIENRNECFYGCGQKKSKQIDKDEAKYNWSCYRVVWMCSKCAGDRAGFYRPEDD